MPRRVKRTKYSKKSSSASEALSRDLEDSPEKVRRSASTARTLLSASEYCSPLHSFEAVQKILQSLSFVLLDISKIPRTAIPSKFDSAVEELENVFNRLRKLLEILKTARSPPRTARTLLSAASASYVPKETEVVQDASTRDLKETVEEILKEDYKELS
jgi:hypothetical protein